MTREEARNFIPQIEDHNPAIFPQLGYISFNDDRISQIVIFAANWTTLGGITAGSYQSESEERFDMSYNHLSSPTGSFFVYFTRNHVPVHPESEEWEYRSYSVLFHVDNASNRIVSISIRSRGE